MLSAELLLLVYKTSNNRSYRITLHCMLRNAKSYRICFSDALDFQLGLTLARLRQKQAQPSLYPKAHFQLKCSGLLLDKLFKQIPYRTGVVASIARSSGSILWELQNWNFWLRRTWLAGVAGSTGAQLEKPECLFWFAVYEVFWIAVYEVFWIQLIWWLL